MQHEQGIATQEACGVDAKREILADAFCRVGLDRVERAQFIPFALHGLRCFTPGRKTQVITTHCSARDVCVLLARKGGPAERQTAASSIPAPGSAAILQLSALLPCAAHL